MRMAFSSFPLPSLQQSPFSGLQSLLIKAGAILAVLLASIGLLLAPIHIPSLPHLLHLDAIALHGLPVTYHQAMRLRQQGDLIGALDDLEKAVLVAPTAVPVLYELGRAEFQLNQVDDAIAHYRDALVQNPDHAPSAYELGSILVTLGSVEEGIQHLRHSVAIAPTPLTYYDLGIALGRRGDQQGEIANLQEAIALQPDYADAHLNLGITYARLGNATRAKRHLQQARALYQAEIERLEHAHLGRNSLDAQIIDQMIAALDSGCGVQCWKS